MMERSWRLTLVADQDGARANIVLLGHLLNALLLEQRAPRASKWAVRFDEDAFALAKVDDVLLWAVSE